MNIIEQAQRVEHLQQEFEVMANKLSQNMDKETAKLITSMMQNRVSLMREHLSLEINYVRVRQ